MGIPAFEFCDRQQDDEGHVGQIVISLGPSGAVPELLCHILLRPSDRIESPRLQIGDNTGSNPILTITVPIRIDMEIMGVLQIGFVDVIDCQREKGVSIGINEPPSSLCFFQAEEPGSFELKRARPAVTVLFAHAVAPS